MGRYGYVRANSIRQAIALLNEPALRSRPLAGGTDLLLILRHDSTLCDRVVDISCIPELHCIGRQADRVTIGAATTFSEVMSSLVVLDSAPLLAEACRQVGAVQIRNMGTIGGNVANAAACADSLPALICLDATAQVLAADGAHEWPVRELVTGPNRTQIPAGGLLVSLSYTVPASGSRSAFLKLGRRNAMATSRLTVAAMGRLDTAGRIAEARVVPGSAMPQIRRLPLVEAALLGQSPREGLWQEAGRRAGDEMIQITGRRWSSEYKEPALGAMVAEALARVFGCGPVSVQEAA